MLRDVAGLTPSQQLTLNDWLSAGPGELQVISITTTPLESLVQIGQFNECLFYRLNTVRIEKANGQT